MSYATIRDVAAKAGLSVTAVSQALNGKGRISEATRRKVREVAAELNYIPDSGARAMRTSTTSAIGLLVPDIRNAYFAELAYCIQDALFEVGYSTLIATSSERVNRQDTLIRNLLAQRIDGVILVPQGQGSPTLKMIAGRGVPLVFVDRSVEGMDQIPLIDSDPRPGMGRALHTLRDYGHKRIGFITGPEQKSRTLNERRLAFTQIAADLFEEDNIAIASTTGNLVSCTAAIEKLSAQHCTAIIFGYSPDTIHAISIFRKRGMEIGKDISVVSFDDIELFKMITPQLSVISQHIETMGKKAVQTVLSLIADSKTGESVDSTASLRGQEYSHQHIATIFLNRESIAVIPS
jgi:LacI family transcriptional regulator